MLEGKSKYETANNFRLLHDDICWQFKIAPWLPLSCNFHSTVGFFPTSDHQTSKRNCYKVLLKLHFYTLPLSLTYWRNIQIQTKILLCCTQISLPCNQLTDEPPRENRAWNGSGGHSGVPPTPIWNMYFLHCLADFCLSGDHPPKMAIQQLTQVRCFNIFHALQFESFSYLN